MNTTAWNVVPLLALLTAAPVALSARPPSPQSVGEQTKASAEKTKDAVVTGAKVVGEKTKDGVSKTGEVMTDGWITTRVKTRLVSDDLLKGSDIAVGTDKHVVTLKGTVTSAAGRTKAGVIAGRTEGVDRVVNQLAIGPKH